MSPSSNLRSAARNARAAACMSPNDFVERKTHPHPGIRYGMFAKKALEPGTLILEETPLCYTEVDEIEDEQEAYGSLTPSEKAKFDTLSGHCRCGHPGDCHEDADTKVWNSNAFAYGNGTAIFYNASHFNHSCLPNACWSISKKGNIEVRVVQRIKKGEEVTQSYFHNIGTTRARRKEGENWGFRCECKACGEGMKISTSMYYRWLAGLPLELARLPLDKC